MDEQAWDELNIVRIDEARRYKRTDRLIREELYSLYINEKRVHTFACTPIDLKELAVGYAFAEGYFNTIAEIETISVNMEAREIQLSLHRSNVFSANANRDYSDNRQPVLSKERIYTLWETFNEKCTLFHITGAVHGMALADGSDILVLYEDAARHNAVAKTIGGMILANINPVGKIFIFSGRLSLKIVMMIERTGVKLLLCHGAVTSDAVGKAETAGITLTGFVRRGYMNIYTHSERITD